MEISLKYYCGMVDITCEINGASITERLSNMKDIVDEEFIENLEQMAQDLREHNEKLK